MAGNKQYNLRLPIEIYDQLLQIKKGRRSNFIRQAIKIALKYEDQSITQLEHEIRNLREELQIKEDLLSTKIEEEQSQHDQLQREKTELKNKKKEERKKHYDSFVNEILKAAFPDFFYNDAKGVISFREMISNNNITIKEIKKIVDSILKDTYSFEDFEKDRLYNCSTELNEEINDELVNLKARSEDR